MSVDADDVQDSRVQVGPAVSQSLGAKAASVIPISVLTINLWQDQGPWQERIAYLIDQLTRLAPDVITTQETRHVEGLEFLDVELGVPNQAETIAHALGYHYVFHPVVEHHGGIEGLAIISRFPIDKSEAKALPTEKNRSPRACLFARLSAGTKTPLNIYTTHLAYRLSDGLLREKQVVAVSDFVNDTRGEGYAVLCGDFNADPDSDEIRYLGGKATLSDAEGNRKRYHLRDAFAEIAGKRAEAIRLAMAGGSTARVRSHGTAAAHPHAMYSHENHLSDTGYTWTSDNPYTALIPFVPKNRRLDYIFVSAERTGSDNAIVNCRTVLNQPNESGIYCSDHFGVMADLLYAPTE